MKEHLRQVMKGRKTSDGMLGKHHTEDSKMKSRETMQDEVFHCFEKEKNYGNETF